MGFPVSDQVDLVLPLLGLETMLGASVMANTTAAEDDDDGPHQPKPCSGGEQTLATAQEPHPNPGNPTKAMEIIRKPRSEPHKALKAEIHVVPGGFNMDLPAQVAALTELGNSVHTLVQRGVCSIGTTLEDNEMWRQG